ncbi:MAG: phospho-N-acetylmuramoyl-pentapeptide-transferase [Candidatus Dadabacteria bacterium]|nr:MAG: phospho-N-acetylmuramoyl-pentapeptide-transferase [Candidatus Dadabacteria bacterium]
MFYHLLYPLHEVYSWLNVFRYQTFRAMLAFLFSFIIVLVLQPVFIRKLQRKGVKGQPIRGEGPKDHLAKQGTPTMGGVVVILAVTLSTLFLADLTNKYVWLTLGVMLSFAALGFVDDWRKVNQQNSRGVPGKVKLFWQICISALAGWLLLKMGFSTELTFPFFKNLSFDLGYWFVPFVVLVVVGTSNAVNLTDGLDGLAIGPVMTVATLYALLAYLAGHKQLADYLAITHISGMGEISIILAAITAAGLGFLWYNTFPAQIFMGDTGALSLGGVLGFIAVLVKHEILLVVAGGIFVVEALSVIIQTYSFKLTGKRVFKMAPIHHHFELKGWAEPKIIVRFWIISIVLALVSLATLKLR